MIHKYFLNGYYIVLDVNSGAIHVVDELIYNMLDLVEPPVLPKCPQSVLNAFKGRYNLDEIYEAYDEIYGLYDIGQLYSEDDYEQFAGMMVNSPIKAMCLHIAHDCNLRCEYCFASTGDFGEGRRLMTYETGKKAIDFLIEHSQGQLGEEV